jgi:hypothetical protein
MLLLLNSRMERTASREEVKAGKARPTAVLHSSKQGVQL